MCARRDVPELEKSVFRAAIASPEPQEVNVNLSFRSRLRKKGGGMEAGRLFYVVFRKSKRHMGPQLPGKLSMAGRCESWENCREPADMGFNLLRSGFEKADGVGARRLAEVGEGTSVNQRKMPSVIQWAWA